MMFLPLTKNGQVVTKKSQEAASFIEKKMKIAANLDFEKDLII